MIRQCPWVYCRAPLPADGPCPRCGYPEDAAELRDPAFFLGRIAALTLPRPMVDMHQILPAYPGIAQVQVMVMDHLGIEGALLQSAPAQATSLLGNDALARVAADHPGRFWVSQFVDPVATTALADLDRVADGGHRVVKLLPVSGWGADDPALEPFWAKMQNLGLVAMVHTGFFTARHKAEEAAAGAFMSSRFGSPLRFDRPCRQFPDLTVILCHAGGAVFAAEAAQMVSQHDHVWADVSGFGLFALRAFLGGITVDWSKLFWGNDSPPYGYPLNLALVVHALASAGAEDLATPLLHDNGATFVGRYL